MNLIITKKCFSVPMFLWCILEFLSFSWPIQYLPKYKQMKWLAIKNTLQCIFVFHPIISKFISIHVASIWKMNFFFFLPFKILEEFKINNPLKRNGLLGRIQNNSFNLVLSISVPVYSKSLSSIQMKLKTHCEFWKNVSIKTNHCEGTKEKKFCWESQKLINQ